MVTELNSIKTSRTLMAVCLKTKEAARSLSGLSLLLSIHLDSTPGTNNSAHQYERYNGIATIDKDQPPAFQFKKTMNGHCAKGPDTSQETGRHTPGKSNLGTAINAFRILQEHRKINGHQ